MSVYTRSLSDGDRNLYFRHSTLVHTIAGVRLPFYVDIPGSASFSGMLFDPSKMRWQPANMPVRQLDEYLPKAGFYNTYLGVIKVKLTAERRAHKGVDSRSVQCYNVIGGGAKGKYTKSINVLHGEGRLLFEILNPRPRGRNSGDLAKHRAEALSQRFSLVLTKLRPRRAIITSLSGHNFEVDKENTVTLEKKFKPFTQELEEIGFNVSKRRV